MSLNTEVGQAYSSFGHFWSIRIILHGLERLQFSRISQHRILLWWNFQQDRYAKKYPQKSLLVGLQKWGLNYQTWSQITSSRSEWSVKNNQRSTEKVCGNSPCIQCRPLLSEEDSATFPLKASISTESVVCKTQFNAKDAGRSKNQVRILKNCINGVHRNEKLILW